MFVNTKFRNSEHSSSILYRFMQGHFHAFIHYSSVKKNVSRLSMTFVTEINKQFPSPLNYCFFFAETQLRIIVQMCVKNKL